ncbi:MAG: hypothetical protein KIS73_16005 [Enhydrobacter sp.]|nr:hypothetical protein [Enhydrobacter sp.]
MESTSLGYDIINGFDCNTDLFAFPQFITKIRSTVATGQLSSATFDSDLAAAVQASNLVQGCAVLFTPTSGDLADRTFLIVNGDNQAGYRAGSDYVIEIKNIEHVAQFGTGNFGTTF